MNSKFLVLVLSAFLVTSCNIKKDKNDGTSQLEEPLQTACGIVIDGKRYSFVDNAIRGRFRAETATTGIFRYEGDNGEIGAEVPVQFVGISTDGISETTKAAAVARVRSMTGNGAILVNAGCEADISGLGRGVVGQVFSDNGESVNESLLKAGFATPNGGYCGGNQTEACYSELKAKPAATPSNAVDSNSSYTSPDGSSGGGAGGTTIRDFLWKPTSDTNGKLVVLINPFRAKIVVNGSESLVDKGPGNGRGTQGKGSRQGCAYGSNVKVQFFAGDGSLIPTSDGRDGIIVPDGCRRYVCQSSSSNGPLACRFDVK